MSTGPNLSAKHPGEIVLSSESSRLYLSHDILERSERPSIRGRRLPLDV